MTAAADVLHPSAVTLGRENLEGSIKLAAIS